MTAEVYGIFPVILSKTLLRAEGWEGLSTISIPLLLEILRVILLKTLPTTTAGLFTMPAEVKLVILPVILSGTEGAATAEAGFIIPTVLSLILPVLLSVILPEGTGLQFTTTTGQLATLQATL